MSADRLFDQTPCGPVSGQGLLVLDMPYRHR